MRLYCLPHLRRIAIGAGISALGFLLAAAPPAVAQGDLSSNRIAIPARTAASLPTATDVGALPSSQRLSLTLTLAPTADRAAALDQFLTDVVTRSSSSYHQWVTPAQFAANFGATADQLATVSAWAQANGLTVDAVSTSGARLTVSGFTPQVEAAFAVTLRSYQVNGGLYYAPQAKPSLPSGAGAIAAVDGLDNLPVTSGGSTISAALSLPTLAVAVDANDSPMLTLDATAATGTLSAAQVAGYRSLFRQAAAQGITTLVSRTATSTGFPANLTDATAVALPGDVADTSAPVDARPTWQFAPGLPADSLRYGPDLTVTSLAALAQTLSSIALRTGGRLGNVNATLYELAPIPDLYTQPDAVAAGTWESATGLGRVDLNRLAQVFPAGTSSAQVSVSSSTGSPIHGQSFTLSSTVTSSAGGATPTGTVTYTAPQAGFQSTTVSLGSNGNGTTQGLLIPGGTYNITASYSGDGTYASSSSSVFILTVQPEAAQFTISSPASVALGANVSPTVTVASASGFGTPNINITVTPSGITGATPSTQTLSGSSGTVTGTFAFTTTQAGTVSFQAQCTPNDSSFTCYTPQTASSTVPQATPTVTLSVAPTSPTAGAAVTLTAPVTGVSGINPTGSVQFFDGTTSLGFGSAPNATYTTSNLLPGQTHSLTAAYLGDTNYVKVTSAAVSVPVATAPTTTSVITSATTATYGQTVTLNITVAGTSTVNGTLPTGTLTFTGAGTVTTATLSGGSANVSLTSLPVGTYTIGTSYSGDANYGASNGNTVVVTVTQSVASLNTSISSTSFTTGSSSTLTVTVTLPGNAQLPSGSGFIASITGISGATYPGTFTVNAGGNTGTGAVTIPAPTAGNYTLQVTCATNTNFTCAPSALSISSTATTGTTSGTTATTTTLVPSSTSPAAGQAITLTATVTAAAAAIAANPISGTVIFYDGTTQIGTGTITAGGTTYTATATVTLTGASHSLTATYSGNTIYAASTSAAVSVSGAAVTSSISLSANTTSVLTGVTVTFTAIVGGTTTAGTAPTGTVSFYLAGNSPALLGTASLSPSGSGLAIATFSTSTLPAGSDLVYAVYKGDANFATVTSADVSLGLSDYNITFVPQTLTLTRGKTGQTTLILGIVNNFAGTVVFGCTPSPNTLITCSFNPTTLTGGGTTTMTVVTTAPASAEFKSAPPLSGKVVGGISFAALVCFLLPGRRRRLPLLLLLFLGLGVSMNIGCSQGNFVAHPANGTAGGTPLGTTTITVSTAGTDGVNTVKHNYTYQVTIQ